jgi:hypothetical protein
MALPVTIPNTFANATASIPLSQLDTNFTTLANAVNGISDGSESLANVSVTGGTISNVAVSATTLNTSGAVVFNDAGADVDFRVEGDTNANLLFVDASADAVGIGTSTPSNTLEVKSPTNDNGIRLSNSVGSYYHLVISNGDGLLFDADAGNTGGTGADIRFQIKGGEKARFTANGYLRMFSGTGGIQFNGDTLAANALDDYEEGDWTPVFKFGATIATQSGTNTSYTKIGRQVTCFVEGYITNLNGGTGTFEISGLPFTNLSMRSTQGVFLFTNMSATFPAGDKSAYIESGDTSLVPVYFTGASGTVSALQHTDFTTSSYVYAQIVYFV